MSVLSEVLEDVRAARGASPVLVFDLDSTLLSTAERNYAILQEFARTEAANPELFVAVEKLAPGDMGWNVMEDLRHRGFLHEPTLRRVRAFWASRFFRDEYLHLDEPLPGAVEFVRDAHAAGGVIVYLTGRDEPNMGRGTRARLAACGFPLHDERVHLRLKPRFEDEDLAFKRSVVGDVRGLGEVVAAFENEPANANLFAEAFPSARVIFLETIHSPDPPPLSPRVVRVRDFRR